MRLGNAFRQDSVPIGRACCDVKRRPKIYCPIPSTGMKRTGKKLNAAHLSLFPKAGPQKGPFPLGDEIGAGAVECVGWHTATVNPESAPDPANVIQPVGHTAICATVL